LENWNTFNGWALARGIHAVKLSPSDFQDLVLYWLMENRNAEELYELERDLTMPPPDFEVPADDPVWGAEAEMGLFMALVPKD
jgi:hypothetical protein